MDKKYVISLDDIEFSNQIGETRNSKTYQSIYLNDNSKCVAKVTYDENHDIEPKFKEYVQILENLNHPGIIPFLGFIPSSLNEHNQNIIINKYASFGSLQQIFEKRSKGKEFTWFDPVRQFIIIYGIANTMKYLHEHNIMHERLFPSNILLDENIEPQITDFKHSMFYPAFDFSISNIIDDKSFYYLDPYTLNNDGKITEKSDVYSFSIITLQILTGNMQIYEKDNDLEELIKGIKNGLLPIVPTNFPEELRELLISCLQPDQELRPSFTHICNKLDSIIDSRPDISTEIFKEYKTKITSEISDKMSQKIAYMKKEADKSDPEMTTNDQTRYKIDDLLNRIHDDIKKNDQEYKCNRKKAEDMSFLFTEGSEERFNKLYYCIKFGIPVLLEGPTGTSKTLSSRIVCQILHHELIYFNLSPKTTIHDLLGHYADDKNSLAEINQKDGPFFTAFTQGKVILLDEINLASPSVLQFIENALENEILSIETPEKSLKFVKMHPNFRIIAIQKITKWQSGLLQQSLSFKFISKFLTISYPAFTEDELLFIGKSFAE